jgi:uncharacterized membrane protein
MLSPSTRIALSRSLIALLFCGMGVLHFVTPGPFLRVMPAIFPSPYALVLISGGFEFAGGVGVLLPFARRLAGIGLIALLIVVYPVNISMFARQVQAEGWNFTTLILLLRLPLQFVLIQWVYQSTRSARSGFEGRSDRDERADG